MINTPQELYLSILAFKADIISTICTLHKPCSVHPLCSNNSSTEVLNFDKVEKELAKGKRSAMPSCDGVSLSKDNSVFCFVEIKGWKKFVDYNIANEFPSISEVEKQKIEEKAASYNLKGKLEHSIANCEEISKQRNVFTNIPYIYVIVTDIEKEKNAIEDFAVNLSSLAETSSVWTICDNSMLQQMNKMDTAIKKVYTHCQDFDACIAEIHA